MKTNGSRPAAWQVALVAVALVIGGAAIGGGAYARGKYDAQNAKKVDGLMAVKSSAPVKKRAGRLVATDKNGRVPDSAKLGGQSLTKLSTMSIPPQSAALFSTATAGSGGPALPANTPGGATVSFVVPATHRASTPVTMDLLVDEESSGACVFAASAGGDFGPSAPGEAANIGNAGWRLKGADPGSDLVSVPGGEGQLHTYTYIWQGDSAPGGYIQFGITRQGAVVEDTCGTVWIVGYQVHY